MYKFIGHRGNKEFYNENTLAGFSSALNSQCISGVELDIQISKDKKLIISHDRFIKINNKKYYIHKYTHEEIQKIIYEQKVPILKNEKSLPLFEDFLALYKDTSKIVLIEIKSLPSHTFPFSIKEIVIEIHTMLSSIPKLDNIHLISFDYRVVVESKKYNQDIKTGLILSRNLIGLQSIVENLQPDILIMQKNWIIKEQVTYLKNHNINVFAWTVNDEKEVKRLHDIGVKYIISDLPETLYNILQTKIN